ncbi:MAG TPA: hypothetical protein VH054_14540 [Polyangiaceae bacterium]|jgi:hypothetical protein|nr:hypothetical protein [Polyangiaceae bacterium]
MTVDVDPRVVLKMLAGDLPADLRAHLLLVGSLAAAYHHRDQRHAAAVRTKDADLVIQPASALPELGAIAAKLLTAGWRPTENTRPGRPTDADADLAVIRLHPPSRNTYFIELLGMPHLAQSASRKWERIELRGTAVDGWYVVPCFRYMALFESELQTSELGIKYASPTLMALANLLAHPVIGPEKIGDTEILRSAKDLGRAVSLAWLDREAIDEWADVDWRALERHFGDEARPLAARAPMGLRALLANGLALSQAYDLATGGLLVGAGVTRPAFEATAQTLLDVLEELAAHGA